MPPLGGGTQPSRDIPVARQVASVEVEPMVIDLLRQEHRNIEKLLLVLEQELTYLLAASGLTTRLSGRLSRISKSIPMLTIIRKRT
jgi:hypothetical protein